MYGDTLVSAVETAYSAPEDLAEVVRLLEQHGEDARLLAGGQSLLILLREGLITPHLLISLQKVRELRTISFSPTDGLEIGAMVTQAEIEWLEHARIHYTALAEAAAVVASPQVRNRGTIGGNLCHADPTADLPPALIALGAELRIAGAGGSRTALVDDFFHDYMDVDLAVSDVLTRISLPPPTRHSGSSYLKLVVRHTDRALVGVAAWVQLGAGEPVMHDVRIGLSGAGVTPIRAVAAERILRGAPIADESIAAAAAAAAADCAPLSDTEASEWYRREMVRVLVQRALEEGCRRAGANRAEASSSTPVP